MIPYLHLITKLLTCSYLKKYNNLKNNISNKFKRVKTKINMNAINSTPLFASIKKLLTRLVIFRVQYIF